MVDLDIFAKELAARVELPMDSPSSLTRPWIILTILGIVLVNFFGATAAVVGGCCGMYLFSLLQWLWRRRKIRKFFIDLAVKSRAQFPNAGKEEVIIGTLLAWKKSDLPPIKVRLPEHY
jgi:hypothetical protein